MSNITIYSNKYCLKDTAASGTVAYTHSFSLGSLCNQLFN